MTDGLDNQLRLNSWLRPSKEEREFFEQDGDCYDQVFPYDPPDFSKIKVDSEKVPFFKSLFKHWGLI